MEHLTLLDAGFLMAEDSDRHVSLAIGAVAIVDGRPPAQDRFKAVLRERISSVPRCTQVLRKRRFDIGAPQWVDDPGFDLSHHLRRVALPRPGGDAELFETVARVLERRLDRDHPLWECWVIEGLECNRWAILMRIHHCVADGISATNILTGLCDVGQRPKATASSKRTPAPRGSGLSIPGLDPLRWAEDLWQASAGLTNTAAHAVAGAAEIAADLLGPATGSSPLTGPVSTMRRYTAVRVPRTVVDDVCRKFEVTLNDVALSVITTGFREVLLSRGEEPLADSLRALVPASSRPAGAVDKPGNRFSLMLPQLPVDHNNPVERLRAVHSRLTRVKHGGARQAGNILVSAAGYIPYMASAWAIRLLTRLPQRGIVALTTNVPGPDHRLQMMGHPVVCVLPIPPIALRLRIGVAALSYADELAFGITADYDAAPDVDELVKGIELEMARLEALSQRSVALFCK